jgi:hypothetical protein
MSSIAAFKSVLKQQMGAPDADFGRYWTAEEIEATCRALLYDWRDRFWTPVTTLVAFLRQVLQVDCSCRSAVALMVGRALAEGQRLPSGDPSAYGQARRRLPLKVFEFGLRQIGQHLRDEVDATLRWCDRRVWLVDGTTCSMPDTRDLQKTFGQPSGQKKGCGFPVARVVALFCWASGAVLEAAIGPYRRSELALWRSLWERLSPGGIVLGDRFYCTFYDFVGVLRRGCDAVFRLHGRRPAHPGRGLQDRQVDWLRPTWNARPRGMTRIEWLRLPTRLTVRLVGFSVEIPGFRSRSITVATTLLDPVAYPAERIAALYRDRWLVELRFRDIKTTLRMKVLRARSADVVCKEIYMHLIAYDLIRALMWQASARHGVSLHRLSFAGAVGRLNALAPYLRLFEGTARGEQYYALLLKMIARDRLPYRPNGVEPRAVKRRRTGFPFLNRPRQQMRQLLLRR